MPTDTDTQMHDKVVITLTTPALERLLNGDKEVEVKLRHAVVENFAKHHIKAILHDGHIQAKLAEIKQMAEEIYSKAVQEKVGTFVKVNNNSWGSSTTQVQLKPEILASINAQVEAAWNRLKDQYVNAAVDKIVQAAVLKLDSVIEYRVKYNLDSMVNEALKKKLASLVH